MKITVLPVRDPELPERRPPASPVRTQPAPSGEFEGMPSTSVELLRAPRRRPAARTPEPPASAAASAEAAAGAPATAATAAAPAAVEIELPNGRIVRVPPGFSSADLERVLAIASEDEPPPR